ncbi:uncharacterized protein [Montipora foliosa]|uniref:uncharacterized protein n=1 Tax=Montipora foliosa TaxID=591990 RepID=UPI0035F20133
MEFNINNATLKISFCICLNIQVSMFGDYPYVDNNVTLEDEPAEPGDTVDAGVGAVDPDTDGVAAVAGIEVTADVGAGVAADGGAQDTAGVVVGGRYTAVVGVDAVAQDTGSAVTVVDSGAGAERESKLRKKQKRTRQQEKQT